MIIAIRSLMSLVIVITLTAIIRFNIYWHKLTDGQVVSYPHNEVIAIRLVYLGIPVVLCFLLMACIILVRERKVAFSILLIIAFILAYFIEESTQKCHLGMFRTLTNSFLVQNCYLGIFGEHSVIFNSAMALNVSLLVIVAILFVIVIGINYAKRKKNGAVYGHVAYREIVPSGETKECPQCAETIKLKARVCRFCNYKFEEMSN